MQIAQVLAGYTLGGADLLRRAMGKKKPEEMAKQRSDVRRGLSRAACRRRRRHLRPDGEVRRLRLQQVALGGVRAAVVPDRVPQAHYPAAFMAAVLSADMDNTDKVVTLKDECDRMALRCGAGRQRLRPRVRGRRPVDGPLRSRGDQGRRPVVAERWSRAHRARSLSDLARRVVPAHRPQQASTGACSRR